MAVRPVHFLDDSDEALACRAAAGDEAAFAAIVDRYRVPIYSYLLHVVHHAESAQDLAQETFVRLWFHLDAYDVTRPLRPWIFRIATNLSRNHFRAIARFRAACEALRCWLHWCSVEDTPRDQNDLQGAEDAIHRALENLPESYRAVVWLRYVDERSSEEIAGIVGLSVGAVEMRLSRARKRLRRALADYTPVGIYRGEARRIRHVR